MIWNTHTLLIMKVILLYFQRNALLTLFEEKEIKLFVPLQVLPCIILPPWLYLSPCRNSMYHSASLNPFMPLYIDSAGMMAFLSLCWSMPVFAGSEDWNILRKIQSQGTQIIKRKDCCFKLQTKLITLIKNNN